MNGKAQTTVELLVILAIGLVILAAFVGFITNQMVILQKTQAQKSAEATLEQLVAAINEVYVQGEGATKQVTVIWPSGIDTQNSSITGKTIRLRVYDSDLVKSAIPNITGSLPTTAGTQRVNVRAFEGFVGIGDLTLIPFPSSVYLAMTRDQNSTSTIRLQSSSSASATVTPSLTWNNTLVSASTNTTPFIISSAADVNRDVNVSAGALAVGQYAGTLQFSASFSDHLESIQVPIVSEIFVGSGSLLTPYPTTLTINVLWDDTNSNSIQLCNLGAVPIKSISFTASSNNAGDWLQGVPSIAQLDAQACTNINFTVVVPTGTGLGTYYGSVLVKDFDGSNTIVIPLTVNVMGMSAAFIWDWNSALRSNTRVDSFGIANTGTKSITLTNIVISGWSACDSNQSPLASIVLNNTTLLSGTFTPSQTYDTTDFTMPVLAYYTQNELNFWGIVNDENEQFRTTVSFSDGTTYVSTLWPLDVCGVDTILPGTVDNLEAIAGDSPASLHLEFTVPGDDGFAGTATAGEFRKSFLQITNEERWNAATPFFPDWDIPAGNTDVSVLVTDLISDITYYFANRFRDETSFNGGISNSPSALVPTDFNYPSNDINFDYFPDSNAISAFEFRNIVLAPGSFPERKIRFSVQENDYNSIDPHTGFWYVDLNFNDVNLTRIYLSYTDVGYMEGVNESDRNYFPNTPYTQGVDITEYTVGGVCAQHGYSCLNQIGGLTGITGPKQTYLDQVVGITSFTVRVYKYEVS